MYIEPPQTPEQVGAAFRAAIERFDPNRPPLVLGHFDADGLSATAILARSLRRAGRSAQVRIMGKGESPWSPEMRPDLEAMAPGGLIATDLGVEEGAILPGVPTVLIDHHVPRGRPGDSLVISGHGWVPEPTSSLLAFWCAGGLAQADDLVWLAATGLVGDMAEGDFPELDQAQARHGKTALRDAVSLINAPRRTALADPAPALALLMRCDGPRDLLRGGHPETEALHAAKAEVAAEMDRVRRTAPAVRGEVAMIRFSSPCQIHPLVAQSWRGRLRDKIVLAVNFGYRPGWVHFAARSATGADLIGFLARHRPPGAGGEYGGGHRQATGGALRPAQWSEFAARIGFPDAQEPA